MENIMTNFEYDNKSRADIVLDIFEIQERLSREQKYIEKLKKMIDDPNNIPTEWIFYGKNTINDIIFELHNKAIKNATVLENRISEISEYLRNLPKILHKHDPMFDGIGSNKLTPEEFVMYHLGSRQI